MLRCGQMRGEVYKMMSGLFNRKETRALKLVASGNINRMLEEEDITTTSAYAKCQDELRRPVAVRAMKQSTNEENYVKDFDYELMKDFGIKTRTASSEKTEKKPLMCHYVFPDYEKPRRIFMKNTKNNDAELNILTITEKPAEHHHNNDQWSPPSFLKSAKSNWRENEGKAPIPKPRDYKMKQSSSTDSDVTGSYANDRINGKISPIAGAQFEDNNTNDEVKTKLKHLLRAEANVDHWQSQMFKPNLEQHVTDHAIPDSFMRNSSKLKEKDQARMEWIGNKGQNPKSHRKSNDSRSLNSPVQTMGRSSAGKSPQSKTTEPRYLGTLKILDSKALPNETSNLEAPDTIRASIYQVWLERKKHLLHEDKKQQKLKTQHENEKREQKIIENKEDAKASFEAWRRKKKNAFQRTDDKKKEEERAKQQAEAEKEEKKGEAEKVFEKWKEEKDQNLKGTLQKQKQIKREKKEKEKEQVTERKKENTSAFMKWNENKRIVLKQKKKEIAKDEQKKKIEEEYTKTGREEMAALVYEKWLEQKDKKEKKQKKIKSASYSDPPPPWSPPNKTIPFRK
ncbi:microtubule-associated protein 9 isoform X8 [Leucoraja erinacea]|uniref:microtubule-associated protein 9 isoform X8 n=1 Tax=Leucoraja erinaceus TaxID=7782 RepID=UPI002458E6E0|nr:microtubule-associated protein 9 isoform X8 [Leucoraja erinacea]